MAKFKDSVVTTSGVEMLNEQLVGRRMAVTSAYTGSGTVEVSELENQIALVYQMQKAYLVELEEADTYKRIRIQLSNTGLETGYKLNQVLIKAALDVREEELDSEHEERAFIIMQDEVGIDVPSEKDSPGWELEMYCVVELSNKLKIDIIVDPAGAVKIRDLEKALSQHNVNTGSHPDIRDEMTRTATKELTIPTAGWEYTYESQGQEDPNQPSRKDYPYQLDLKIDGVTADHIPNVFVWADYLALADVLCPTCETVNGAVRLYATGAPKAEIMATLVLTMPGKK